MEELTKRGEELKELWRKAFAANKARDYRKEKIEDEEFYHSDVANTKSEFNEKQIGQVKSTYNIPISTKIAYALSEYILSFLTASKPQPRLLVTQDSTEDFTYNYQKLLTSTFYESSFKSEFHETCKDMVNVGEGYMYVRKSYFYNESTTNVVVENIDWKQVLIDPEARKPGYFDANYFVIMDTMSKKKAEKYFGIKIKPSDTVADWESPARDIANEFTWEQGKNDRYVMILRFIEKDFEKTYICSNEPEEVYGIVSLEEPEPIPGGIPNKQKQEMEAEMAQLQQMIEQAERAVEAEAEEDAALDNAPVSLQTEKMKMAKGISNQGTAEAQQNVEQMRVALQEIQELYRQQPDRIDAFTIITQDEREMVITNYVEKKEPRWLESLMVGNKVHIDKQISPAKDKPPLINYTLNHAKNPNRTRGIIHKTKDLAKAMNKYLAMMMLQVSQWGHRRGYAFRDTIVNTEDLEANKPGWIFIDGDPNLPDGGLPRTEDPAPLSQAHTYLFELFKSLAEYITGIFGVMQGDAERAPETYGATNSLQNFGSQRVKMYARQLERPFEHLSYVLVAYLQAYCPRDIAIRFFDHEGNADAIQLMDDGEFIDFKVRVELASSMPTMRQMVSQLLGFIAQTVSDDSLKALITEYMLKALDVPEGKEISEKMNVIQQLQQQLAQMQQQLEEMSNENKILKNQNMQKDTEQVVNQATAKAEKDIAVSAEKAKAQAENNPEDLSQIRLEE